MDLRANWPHSVLTQINNKEKEKPTPKGITLPLGFDNFCCILYRVCVKVLCQLLGFAVIEAKFAEWGICMRSVNCPHHSHEDNMKADFAASLCFQNYYESPVLLFSFLELGLWPGVITVLKFDKMNIPVRRGYVLNMNMWGTPHTGVI